MPGATEEQLSRVPESVVQDIWAKQYFERSDLRTTRGVPVRIVNPGRLNTDAGPDFLSAQIVIDKLRWFGDIEIHTASGVWYEHQHDSDPRYNNVVLHVTLRADIWTGKLLRQDGTAIPEIVLAPQLSQSVGSLVYQLARTDRPEIACSTEIGTVSSIIVDTWVRRLARLRIEKRMTMHANRTRQERSDHFLQMIFRTLGYAKNAHSMVRLYQLASPFFSSMASAIECRALLLGIAGLLPPIDSIQTKGQLEQAYLYGLINTFVKLDAIFSLPVMKRSEWNFFRLRPASFPDVRVLQAADLIDKTRCTPDALSFRSLRECLDTASPLLSLRSVFDSRRPKHSRYRQKYERNAQDDNQPGDRAVPPIGTSRIDRIIINAVAPYVLLESVLVNDEATAYNMLKVLSRLPPEKDSVTNIYESFGWSNRDAYFSQGLHELYREYCIPLRCLTCDIGRELIQPTST